METYINTNNSEALLNTMLQQYENMKKYVAKLQRTVDQNRAILSDDVIAGTDEMIQSVSNDLIQIEKHIEKLTGVKLEAMKRIAHIESNTRKEIQRFT